MTRVTVDGIDYTPAGTTQNSTFGVGITTRNRPEQLKQSLQRWRQHSPTGTPIFVVDDASDTPTPEADFRFDRNVGIATAKNKCLQLLMATGVDHLFLVDDDCYPLTDNWWQPYLESPEPHLFAVFASPTAKSSRIEVLYRDSRHVAYHATRGYFLYFHRSVIDRVGGFDTRFFNAFEHVELSNRIHNAGLTTWPYQDVAGSENLIYSLDSKPGNRSVISDATRKVNEQRGRELLKECESRSEFVPYGTDDIVFTCLFTGQTDPQRGTRMKPDPALADQLLATCNATVLCDFDTDRTNFIRVETTQNPYIQRWISYRQHLLSHPEVRFVWCVDATDVQQLRDPFAMMQSGVLYCGWENQIVGCQWMLQNHLASRDWITANAHRNLLNAGVVGGDRATMLTFISRLLQQWTARPGDAAGDMAYFNAAAYSMMPNLETGPRITTLFKANQPNDFSLWKHK